MINYDDYYGYGYDYDHCGHDCDDYGYDDDDHDYDDHGDWLDDGDYGWMMNCISSQPQIENLR